MLLDSAVTILCNYFVLVLFVVLGAFIGLRNINMHVIAATLGGAVVRERVGNRGATFRLRGWLINQFSGIDTHFLLIFVIFFKEIWVLYILSSPTHSPGLVGLHQHLAEGRSFAI